MIIILIIVLILVLIFWGIERKKLKVNIEETTSTLTSLNNGLKQKITELENKNTSLSKYQVIIDIEKKSKEIIFEANKIAEDKIQEAQNIVSEANEIANSTKLSASQYSNELKQNGDTYLKNAQNEYNLTIENANKKAEEIAGDAYKAMQNAAEYQKTARAMKNIIEGYGDKYLIPTFSLLDDLAEEFGHTEAGEKLRLAREKTKFMVLSRTAAKCDYAESNRRETAILFVTDAFNGKVDSILSKVKKDNYGTLEQKIRDACQIVNSLGVPFKNAAITQEFCNARVTELKWAVIAQELKFEEQEEQRRIKEQIREEEKARREFEKAIKDAQKEEETLKKLIEKAQKEVSQANDAQKAIFDEKLKELEIKLKAAEEKNQRALSMAQQTKSGNVYIISNIGSFGENVYKIGMTRRLEPLDRVRELGDASVPFSFDVHTMIYSDNAPGLERELHKKFLRLQMNKVNPRKEFFKVALADIKNEIETLGLSVKWTMTSEAKEYRESLMIEETISKDKEKQAQWLKHQLEIDPVTIENDEDNEM